jgi:hypothetical protein
LREVSSKPLTVTLVEEILFHSSPPFPPLSLTAFAAALI